MIFDKFMNNYKLLAREEYSSNSYKAVSNLYDEEKELNDLFKSIGGMTFNNGILRICTPEYSYKYTKIFQDFFIGLKNNIQVFAFDWLGRHFAIDFRFRNKNIKQILLVEPGAGDALEIPGDLDNFFNYILIEMAEDALAVNFFNEWYKSNKTSIDYNKSVGYKVPLFLGGEDDLSNLEIIDTEVYVNICGQLRNKIKTLPKGMTINQISIND